MEKEVKWLIARIAKLETKVNKSSEDVTLLNLLNKLQIQVNKVQDELNEIQSEVSEVQVGLDGVKNEVTGVRSEVQGMQIELNEVRNDITNVKDDMTEVQVELNEVQVELSDVGLEVESQSSYIEKLRNAGYTEANLNTNEVYLKRNNGINVFRSIANDLYAETQNDVLSTTIIEISVAEYQLIIDLNEKLQYEIEGVTLDDRAFKGISTILWFPEEGGTVNYGSISLNVELEDDQLKYKCQIGGVEFFIFNTNIEGEIFFNNFIQFRINYIELTTKGYGVISNDTPGYDEVVLLNFILYPTAIEDVTIKMFFDWSIRWEVSAEIMLNKVYLRHINKNLETLESNLTAVIMESSMTLAAANSVAGVMALQQIGKLAQSVPISTNSTYKVKPISIWLRNVEECKLPLMSQYDVSHHNGYPLISRYGIGYTNTLMPDNVNLVAHGTYIRMGKSLDGDEVYAENFDYLLPDKLKIVKDDITGNTLFKSTVQDTASFKVTVTNNLIGQVDLNGEIYFMVNDVTEFDTYHTAVEDLAGRHHPVGMFSNTGWEFTSDGYNVDFKTPYHVPILPWRSVTGITMEYKYTLTGTKTLRFIIYNDRVQVSTGVINIPSLGSYTYDEITHNITDAVFTFQQLEFSGVLRGCYVFDYKFEGSTRVFDKYRLTGSYTGQWITPYVNKFTQTGYISGTVNNKWYDTADAVRELVKDSEFSGIYWGRNKIESSVVSWKRYINSGTSTQQGSVPLAGHSIQTGTDAYMLTPSNIIPGYVLEHQAGGWRMPWVYVAGDEIGLRRDSSDYYGRAMPATVIIKQRTGMSLASSSSSGTQGSGQIRVIPPSLLQNILRNGYETLNSTIDDVLNINSTDCYFVSVGRMGIETSRDGRSYSHMDHQWIVSTTNSTNVGNVTLLAGESVEEVPELWLPEGLTNLAYVSEYLLNIKSTLNAIAEFQTDITSKVKELESRINYVESITVSLIEAVNSLQSQINQLLTSMNGNMFSKVLNLIGSSVGNFLPIIGTCVTILSGIIDGIDAIKDGDWTTGIMSIITAGVLSSYVGHKYLNRITTRISQPNLVSLDEWNLSSQLKQTMKDVNGTFTKSPSFINERPGKLSSSTSTYLDFNDSDAANKTITITSNTVEPLTINSKTPYDPEMVAMLEDFEAKYPSQPSEVSLRLNVTSVISGEPEELQRFSRTSPRSSSAVVELVGLSQSGLVPILIDQEIMLKGLGFNDINELYNFVIWKTYSGYTGNRETVAITIDPVFQLLSSFTKSSMQSSSGLRYNRKQPRDERIAYSNLFTHEIKNSYYSQLAKWNSINDYNLFYIAKSSSDYLESLL